jgi:peptidoglycan hydrolase CwlO-like protein
MKLKDLDKWVTQVSGRLLDASDKLEHAAELKLPLGKKFDRLASKVEALVDGAAKQSAKVDKLAGTLEKRSASIEKVGEKIDQQTSKIDKLLGATNKPAQRS